MPCCNREPSAVSGPNQSLIALALANPCESDSSKNNSNPDNDAVLRRTSGDDKKGRENSWIGLNKHFSRCQHSIPKQNPLAKCRFSIRTYLTLIKRKTWLRNQTMAPGPTSLTLAAGASIVASGWAAGKVPIQPLHDITFVASLALAGGELVGAMEPEHQNHPNRADKVCLTNTYAFWTHRHGHGDVCIRHSHDPQRGCTKRGHGPPVAVPVRPRLHHHTCVRHHQRRQLLDGGLPLLHARPRVARVRGGRPIDLLHHPFHRGLPQEHQ